MASININEFFSSINTRLEAPVREHLKKVYTCFSLATLAATAGAYVHVFTNLLQGNFISSLISLGLMVALSATPDSGKNQKIRLGFLLGFAFFTGLGLGPLLDMAIMIDPSLIVTAFMGTTVVFVCFSISALYSEQRKWLYLGGTLMSILSAMFFLSLANIFFGSKLLFQAYVYIGLAVFCAFILYDTQAIIEKRRRGDKDYIWHCVDLFLDFISVFRHLLVILMQSQEDKRKKRSKD